MTETDRRTLKEKKQHLMELLKQFDALIVAFSGGVDSTFLLAAAKEALGTKVLAVTASSPVHPKRETDAAADLARQMGVEHVVLRPGEMELTDFTANTKDRCYVCKKHLLKAIFRLAEEKKIAHVVHGANVDDDLDFRPGARAATEMGVRAPLSEAGLKKDEIRILSRGLGLSTWDKPAMACLASRIPYGTRITRKALDMVDRGEAFLFSLGFAACRVRHHGRVARIEVPPEAIEKIVAESVRNTIAGEFKTIGFTHISVDIEGYVQGSMNRDL